jgi:hypothetical protein
LKNILNFNAWLFENEERDDFYKKELNPSFWKDDKFDPQIREKLLKISKDFYEALKLTAPIKDIQLTGSLANYNEHTAIRWNRFHRYTRKNTTS